MKHKRPVKVRQREKNHQEDIVQRQGTKILITDIMTYSNVLFSPEKRIFWYSKKLWKYCMQVKNKKIKLPFSTKTMSNVYFIWRHCNMSWFIHREMGWAMRKKKKSVLFLNCLIWLKMSNYSWHSGTPTVRWVSFHIKKQTGLRRPAVSGNARLFRFLCSVSDLRWKLTVKRVCDPHPPQEKKSVVQPRLKNRKRSRTEYKQREAGWGGGLVAGRGEKKRILLQFQVAWRRLSIIDGHDVKVLLQGQRDEAQLDAVPLSGDY